MHWSSPYPATVYWLAIFGAAALVILARWLAISPKLRSWTLFVPRGIVLATLLVILLHPVRKTQQRLPPQPAEVAYLVDCSRSMALDRPTSRLDRVKQTIVEAQSRLAPDAHPHIQVFRFGEQLSASPDVGPLVAEDDATQLVEALARLPSRLAEKKPRAVVVFSDGAADTFAESDELAASYRKMGVPLHVLGVGDTSLQGDLAISQVTLPRKAAVGDRVTIRAVLRSFGYEGRRVVAQIRPKGRAHAQPIASLPLTLTGGEQPCEFVLDVDPEQRDLEIIAPVQANEAIVSNNRVPFRLAGGSRKTRVLYMEGTLANEYRWIRDALHEDPEIECVPIVVNQQYAERPQLQRIDDPLKGYPATREELFTFDVIICSDISQGAFTREQIEWTVELVARRGGGFAMIGGHTSYGSGGWDRTEWEKLIPFDMTGRRDFLAQTFRVRVPTETLAHPIWRLLEDKDASRRAVEAMPPFHGTNLISRVKPAATLLAESANPLSVVGMMPVMACETFGRGRTFALSSDSTVDWGRDFESRWGEGDNRHFRKFWRNVVRWLSENSIAGSRRLHVETDKVIYRPGEPIQVTARAFDDQMAETISYQVTARLANVGEQASGVQAALTPTSADKVYRGEIAARLPKSAGNTDSSDVFLQPLALEVVAMEGSNEIARPVVEVQVLDDSPELLRVKAEPENLEPLATQSGGKALRSADDLAAVLNELRPSPGEEVVHQTPLWDRTWIWLSLVALLGLEWSLRRRAGFG